MKFQLEYTSVEQTIPGDILVLALNYSTLVLSLYRLSEEGNVCMLTLLRPERVDACTCYGTNSVSRVKRSGEP